MKSENAQQNVVSEHDPATRNPFGVTDVPNPNDDGVMQFARVAGRIRHRRKCKPVERSRQQLPARHDRRSMVEPLEGGHRSHHPGRCPRQMETGPGRSAYRRRPRVPVIRLGFRRAQGPDRRKARRSAPAGGQVYQPEQPGDHGSLGRPGGEQSANRRVLFARPGRFPEITFSNAPTPPAQRGAAIAVAGRRHG
jgi:hypothetical protein